MTVGGKTEPWVQECEGHSLMLEKTLSLEDPFVVAGSSAYMVGDQHGMFPPVGFHISGEMGGIWTHTAKMVDGFWLRLRGPGGEFWLEKASRFVTGPGFVEHLYELPDLNLHVTRRDWAPDALPGIVVEYHLKNVRDVEIPLEMELLSRVNLRPCWRAEEMQIRDGEDVLEFVDEVNAIRAEDTLNGWAVVLGTDRTPLYHQLGSEIQGRNVSYGEHGAGSSLFYSMDIGPREWVTVRLFVAGSTASPDEALAHYKDLVANHPLYFEEKMARHTEVANVTRLATSDPAIDEAFTWAKVGYESLAARTDVGRGMLGGFFEMPWFSVVDICLAARPALAVGRADLVRDSLSLLVEQARALHDGQEVPCEVTGMGASFERPNRINLSLLILALQAYLDWTGDKAFVVSCLPVLDSIQRFVAHERTGLDLLPAGAGFIAKPALRHRMVDVASLLVPALRALGDFHALANNGASAALYRRKASDMESAVQECFWVGAQGLFADMVASEAEIEKIHEGVLRRLKGVAVEKLRESYPAVPVSGKSERAWVGKHWICVAPFWQGVASPAQAEQAFRKLETGQFIAPWGMMGQAGLDKKVTLLATAVLALAQVRYGRLDAGLQTIKRVALSLRQGQPGGFAEFLPDQGCFMRSFGGLALVDPIVHGMLGIRPRLGERQIDFTPDLPSAWSEAVLDAVPVGEFPLSFRCRRVDGFLEATVRSPVFGPSTFVGLAVPQDRTPEVFLNGAGLRKWDTEEKLLDGRRYVGARVSLTPGTHSVRVTF